MQTIQGFITLYLLILSGVSEITARTFSELDGWKSTSNLDDSGYDVVIFINDFWNNLPAEFSQIEEAIQDYAALGQSMTSGVFVPFLSHPSKRLILGLTGNLSSDYADSRLIYNAAKAAATTMTVLELGNPLLVVGPFNTKLGKAEHPWAYDKWPQMTSILGLFHQIFIPLQVRESMPDQYPSIDSFGVYKPLADVLTQASAIERGIYVNRDLCESDQERMTPPKIRDYINEEFAGLTSLTLSSADISKDAYPTMDAVNRVVQDVSEYNGTVIKMDYTPTGPVTNTYFFVGKGVTYDTGGLSLRTGGGMRWMRKDKCGATAVVGFMRTLSMIGSSGLRVHARLGFVRNGFGSEAFAVDEIIASRAGIRSLIGSTDAEGRNVMVDLITEAVEEITNDAIANAHIFTVATLTGHVDTSFGHIPAVLDNGPARKLKMSQHIRNSGALLADLAQVSSLRLEDYENCYPATQYEDLQQRNTHPDTVFYRGHQYPSAWMLMASKLDRFGLNSTTQQIGYTHLDISAAVGVKRPDGTATDTPIPMLTVALLLQPPSSGSSK